MKPIRLTINYQGDTSEDMEFQSIFHAVIWLLEHKTWSSYMIIGTNT